MRPTSHLRASRATTALAALLGACDGATPAPPIPPPPVLAPVAPPSAPSAPPPTVFERELAAQPSFHEAVELRATASPIASQLPQLAGPDVAFYGLAPRPGDPMRGLLLCAVQLTSSEPWDPGRWNTSRTAADVRVTVTVADLGTVRLEMRDDFDAPIFSLPGVELRGDDTIVVSLEDRDFGVSDAIGTVRLRFVGETPVVGSVAAARVECRSMPEPDAEQRARASLAALDATLVRLAARRVDLLAENGVVGPELDTIRGYVRDAASFVGYAHPLVQEALARIAPFERGADDAVRRAMTEARADLPPPGSSVRVSTHVRASVRDLRCGPSASARSTTCTLTLEEVHQRIPEPPGFDAAVGVRLLSPDGTSTTCRRAAPEPGASSFVETSEPVTSRHECELASTTSAGPGTRLVVLEHDGKRRLARVD